LAHQPLLAAEPLLQKLVDGKDKYPIDHVVWARRQLALSVAARGGYQNLQAARKLIEANLALGDPSVQDLRARATFQAVDADPAPTPRRHPHHGIPDFAGKR